MASTYLRFYRPLQLWIFVQKHLLRLNLLSILGRKLEIQLFPTLLQALHFLPRKTRISFEQHRMIPAKYNPSVTLSKLLDGEELYLSMLLMNLVVGSYLS